MSESTAQAVMETSKGTINLKLFPDLAPVTVANFANLALRGFYNGLAFHRVIPDFMIQGGCPMANGRGGPGYQFEDELSMDIMHDSPGKLSMANAGPGTNGSQFFITHLETPWLDGRHTIFGEVMSEDDMKVVNAIGQDDKIETLTVTGVDELLSEQSERINEWNQSLEFRGW